MKQLTVADIIAEHAQGITWRKPIFGVGSLLIPVLGFGLGWYFVEVLSHRGGDPWGWGRAAVFLGIQFLALIGGLFSALIAAARQERYLAVAITGMILNGGLILLALFFLG